MAIFSTLLQSCNCMAHCCYVGSMFCPLTLSPFCGFQEKPHLLYFTMLLILLAFSCVKESLKPIWSVSWWSVENICAVALPISCLIYKVINHLSFPVRMVLGSGCMTIAYA